MTRTLLASLLILAGCFEGSDDKSGGGNAGPMPTLSGDGGGGSASADSDEDDDGYTLEEEEAAGTNPDYGYSHPYEGGYNVGFCDTPPVPTGPTGLASISQSGETYEWPSLAMGDVPYNFSLPDQFGEEVDLYSFCGQHVMVVISAGWCGPCRGFATEVQNIQEEYEDKGFQIIEIITQDDYGNPPDQAFLQNWASDYGFDGVPVLGAPQPTSYDHPTFWFDADGYIPSVYHLNEKLEVVSADESVHDPSNWL